MAGGAGQRDFTVFWFGQTLAELGNSFALVALPLLVLTATGSVAQMGLLTAVAGVATIGTGLVAGGLVDRLDRRRLMIGCDLARAALFAAVPVVWLVHPQVWLLYVVMASASVFGMIFKVGYVAAVPTLMPGARILEANRRLESTNAVSFVVGPVLAGLLCGALGPALAIAVNAAGFGVSAIALATIRFGSPPRTGTRREAGHLDGYRFLWGHPVLRRLTVLLTVVTFVSLGMIDVVVFQVREGLGQDDRVVGVVLGLAGVGTVLAALGLPVLRRSLGFGGCWLGAYALCGLAVAGLAMSTGVVAVAVAMLGYSFGMGVAGISSMTLRQAVTPDHLLGRVTSAFWTVHGALAPLGAAVLTGLVAAFGVRGPLLGAAAAFLVVVAVGLGTPIRHRNPERIGQRNEPALMPLRMKPDSEP